MRSNIGVPAIMAALTIGMLSACAQNDRQSPQDSSTNRSETTAAAPKAASDRVEVVEQRWDNGELRLRKEVIRNPDGSLANHGTYTRWFQDGQKEYEATFVDGQIDGVETQWHSNGQKRVEQHYVMGLREGKRLAWDEKGNLRLEESYANDRPHGTWTIWTSGGRVKWQQRYENGDPVED